MDTIINNKNKKETSRKNLQKTVYLYYGRRTTFKVLKQYT